LRVGLVGPLPAQPVAGARFARGELATMPSYPLVLVSAETTDLATVEARAQADPATHYAYVGGSTKGHHAPNLVGLVLDDARAAQLGGLVAGLVAGDQGGRTGRVAWVGPEERALATAYARGAQQIQPGTTVLRAWSQDLPASCKEAALGAIARGAVAVMAHGGLCADAAIEGAHQQNRVGLRISDFELLQVPVSVLIRDAVAGVYRGGEDLVFRAASGAIGVQHLDSRISADTAVRARSAAQQLAAGLRPAG
jgi:basic membrane lipoprotein Med (substrate-binding protein (PBP1-ABC) superfamily)